MPWIDLRSATNHTYDNTTSGLTSSTTKTALDELAAAVGVDSLNLTKTAITASQTAAVGNLYVVDSTSGDITVTLPATANEGEQVGLLLTEGTNNAILAPGASDVINDDTASVTLTTLGGLIIVQAAGDDTSWYTVAANATVAEPYYMAGFYPGAPTASAKMMVHVFPVAVDIASAMAGSYGTAETAATAQTDFDVQKNGVSAGTMRFAAAATTATFIMASATSFALGDKLQLIAPATPDATLADVAWTFKGTRT